MNNFIKCKNNPTYNWDFIKTAQSDITPIANLYFIDKYNNELPELPIAVKTALSSFAIELPVTKVSNHPMSNDEFCTEIEKILSNIMKKFYDFNSRR